MENASGSDMQSAYWHQDSPWVYPQQQQQKRLGFKPAARPQASLQSAASRQDGWWGIAPQQQQQLLPSCAESTRYQVMGHVPRLSRRNKEGMKAHHVGVGNRKDQSPRPQ